MKKNLAIFSLIVSAVFLFTACKKVEDLPYYNDGNTITLEASKTAVTATAADSANNVITFSWTSPRYASDSATYKYVLEIDSASRNFSKKATKTIIGARTRSLTGKELNDIVLNYGFSLGTPYNMDVRLVSSYGNNNEQHTSKVVRVVVTPYKDSSVLTSTQTSVVCALATTSTNSLTFNWSRSFNGYTGIVNYTLQYDSAGKNFVLPQDIVVGPSLLTKAMTQGDMNTTALNSGIPGGNSGKVEYRIKAVTTQGATVYSNVVFVTIQSYVPILRLYMPGSYQVATGYGGADWEPTTAPELIRDLRTGLFNNMYYIYIYLPANTDFKITEGRAWTTNYGGTGGTLAPGGANLHVTTAGVYRISVNRATLKYDIRVGRMGFVGGGTGAGWTPPNVFPTYALGAPATNLFVGLTNLTTADAWKLIDNDAWNSGSNLPDETRSYGSAGGSGSAMEINTSTNFATIATNGRYRAIWDGRDPNNIKYEMSPATEMRLVGDGINMIGVTDWDPPTSPQMTYSGNGVWTITIALKANKEIKFVAGNAWGAFDYEDNSGQTQALGTSRPMKWEGGNNFKTPTVAGTYTITLNENTQRVTIN
jgi:starch-binding outer membrane protein SusE/F